MCDYFQVREWLSKIHVDEGGTLKRYFLQVLLWTGLEPQGQRFVGSFRIVNKVALILSGDGERWKEV